MIVQNAERLSTLTPATADQVRWLLGFAEREGFPNIRVDSAWRSCSAQQQIYDQGRETGGPIVTGVSGCRTWHAHGRAVDLFIPGAGREDYEVLGRAWEARGGVWGGDWQLQDLGHFEWHPGFEIGDVCPTGAECFGPPWPEDRPWHARPTGRALFGFSVAAAGVVVALQLSRS